MKYLAFAAALAALPAAASPSVPARPVPAITQTYRFAAEHGSAHAAAALGFLLFDEDSKAALPWLLAAARAGDAECQIAAAGLLRRDHNYEEAAYWYSKASVRSVRAVYLLGTMYESGQGLQASARAASRLFRRAAVAGLAESATRLGNLYMIGSGVRQDYQEARRWYLRAAAQGDGEALLNLAGLFYHGLGVKRDIGQARGWAVAAKRCHARDADAILALIDTANAESAP